jgi:hypothetical protein
MMMIATLLAAALATVPIAGEWPTYPVAQAPAAWRPAVQRGDLVIVSVQSAVMRELRAAMAQGGPGHALTACHLDAAAAALTASRREGIAVGRTSARLRNARNAPPPWAVPIVARYDGKAAGDAAGFVVDLGDRVGLLRPIVEQSMCAACHGPAAQMAPAVRASIAARYPSDRAVGFDTGDIRGWFWVEIPKRATTSA